MLQGNVSGTGYSYDCPCRCEATLNNRGKWMTWNHLEMPTALPQTNQSCVYFMRYIAFYCQYVRLEGKAETHWRQRFFFLFRFKMCIFVTWLDGPSDVCNYRHRSVNLFQGLCRSCRGNCVWCTIQVNEPRLLYISVHSMLYFGLNILHDWIRMRCSDQTWFNMVG